MVPVIQGRPKEFLIWPENLELGVSKNLVCRLFTEEESPLTSGNKKRCGVEFGELTPKQTSQLADFIEHHTIGEA